MRRWGLLAATFLISSSIPVRATAEVALPRLMAAELSQLRLDVAGSTPAAGKGEDFAERAAIAAFYGCHAEAPLWTIDGRLTAKAVGAIEEIRKADDWGLNAAAFEVPDPAASVGARNAAETEVKLSLAAIKYARHARGGRIPDPARQLASYLDRKPELPEPAAILASLAATSKADAFLRDMHPKHAGFERLRQELLKSRSAKNAVGPRLPSGPTLRLGDEHAHVALLRKRLGVPAPLGEDGQPRAELFDAALADKVKEFQRQAGLGNPSGTLGPKTRSELNEGIEETSDQSRRILANMEQWRWMPADLGAMRVEVNVPEFQVRVIKDAAVVHAERVVTGKTSTQTPIFSDTLRSVVFQPHWGLPDSIKINEVLPRLQRGEGLRSDLRMQRNGKEVNPDKVNWAKADIREYLVYQPSGDDNALGVVKFLFPNKHQVYMHDTPSKGLFRETVRTYSHGCVRVRNPVRLAEVLLSEDKGWDSKKIKSLTDDGPENNRIGFDTRIPVHITYFTMTSGEDGRLQTHRDIYGHENRIALALEGKWSQIPKLPDHLAPVSLPTAQVVASRAKAKAPQVADDEYREGWSRKKQWSRPPAVAYVPPQIERRGNRVYYAAPPPQFVNRYGLTRAPQPTFFQKLFGAN